MSLQKWDREIAPYLRGIEARGKTIAGRASELHQVVSYLRQRPEFLTLAEDALSEAETNLAAALEDVRAARAQYAAVPVERASLVAAE